jgi:hypothetical protein
VAHRYPKEEDGGQNRAGCPAEAEATACRCCSKPLCVRALLPQAIEGGRGAVGCAVGMTEAM